MWGRWEGIEILEIEVIETTSFYVAEHAVCFVELHKLSVQSWVIGVTVRMKLEGRTKNKISNVTRIYGTRNSQVTLISNLRKKYRIRKSIT